MVNLMLFLGFRRGDLLNEDDFDVKEVVKRFFFEDFNLRQFRIKRVFDLIMKYIILFKEYWIISEEVCLCLFKLFDFFVVI